MEGKSLLIGLAVGVAAGYGLSYLMNNKKEEEVKRDLIRQILEKIPSVDVSPDRMMQFPVETLQGILNGTVR